MELSVLITSAGRRVGLAEAFRESARELGFGLRLLACDLRPELSAACSIADHAFAVPRCDDPAYPDAILRLCERESVDLVVPTIDTELKPLAYVLEAAAMGGTRIHVSPADTIDIVRDKSRTAEHLGMAGLPVPRTVPLETVAAGGPGLGWPVFVKPRAGSASRALSVAHSLDELPVMSCEPMVAQTYLRGKEYTVNIFIDQHGVLRSVVPHWRIGTRAGEVEKGVTVRNHVFEELAMGIVEALPEARGVMCFQLIDDVETGPQIIEINARFGGGYPLAHRAGATFTRWLLEEVGGLSPSCTNDWTEGLMMLRYDAAVFSPSTL